MIPTHMHIVEFCEFIEPHRESICQARVLRSSQPNQYIVVLKLASGNQY
jgi:hypothetical protein